MSLASSFIQVNYLLDHLNRATKISKRKIAGSLSHHDCLFDISNNDHLELWRLVFINNDDPTDENVLPPCS